MSRNTTVWSSTQKGFSKATLKKCKYDDLLRLAKFMKLLQVGDHPSPGYLADLVSRAMQRRVQRGVA